MWTVSGFQTAQAVIPEPRWGVIPGRCIKYHSQILIFREKLKKDE